MKKLLVKDYLIYKPEAVVLAAFEPHLPLLDISCMPCIPDVPARFMDLSNPTDSTDGGSHCSQEIDLLPRTGSNFHIDKDHTKACIRNRCFVEEFCGKSQSGLYSGHSDAILCPIHVGVTLWTGRLRWVSIACARVNVHGLDCFRVVVTVQIIVIISVCLVEMGHVELPGARGEVQ